MSDTIKTPLLFAIVALLLVVTGLFQGWNSALLIMNMGLISAIMALGVNLQWGFAGLFNIGVMGFVALGGLAAVLVSTEPVPEAWQAGGLRIFAGLALLQPFGRLFYDPSGSLFPIRTTSQCNSIPL